MHKVALGLNTLLSLTTSACSEGDAFVDAGNRLYVGGGARAQILVFDNASTLNGDVMPNRVLTLSGASGFAGAAVDSTGDAYVTELPADAIHVVHGVAAKNGTMAADRTLRGAKTGLSSPGHLTVVEE